MKTKNKNIIYLIICILITSGILFTSGIRPASGFADGGGQGWKQYAGRESQFYCSPFGVDVSVDYLVGTETPLIRFNLTLSMEMIDCCGPNLDPHSWCNYNADDSRCGN